MQNSASLKKDLKTFVIINFSTGIFMILFSIVGHFLTPYKLIPSSIAGGTIGLVSRVHLCSKLNFINIRKFFPVTLSSLTFFGAVSFVAVFNLHSPAVILLGFPLTGLMTIISNRYFVDHNIAGNKIYGTIGLMLASPAVYFVVASILKFQFGYDFLFSFVEKLLSRTNGQENFNAITPFLFGGGLLLAFSSNIFCQIENIKTTNILSYKSLRWRLNVLNLVVVILSGMTGLAILSYLAVESL